MSTEHVYHVSEEPGLQVFAPRPDAEGVPRVWAIDDARLHNYLVPRDCPRVTFYATEETTEADRQRYIPHGASSVVAIERAWLRRALEAQLYVYAFDAAPFEMHDEIAGYRTASCTVEPLRSFKVEDPIGEIVARGAEFRVVEDLAALRAAVIHSSLGFSIIRWRNASPEP